MSILYKYKTIGAGTQRSVSTVKSRYKGKTLCEWILRSATIMACSTWQGAKIDIFVYVLSETGLRSQVFTTQELGPATT